MLLSVALILMIGMAMGWLRQSAGSFRNRFVVQKIVEKLRG